LAFAGAFLWYDNSMLFEKYPNDYASYRKIKDEYLKILKTKMSL